LLQGITARVRPGNDDAVARLRDGQHWCPGGLHQGDETPKAAGEGIIAAGHCGAGIVLADGATDGINGAAVRAGAGAAAAGNFKPVNRISLRLPQGRNQQTKKENEFFHDWLLFSIKNPTICSDSCKPFPSRTLI